MEEIVNTEYLKLLAEQYPSIPAASTELINLSAIMNLPKGTEHFVSDIHGEYEAFHHVLKNGSGSIRRKIDELFEDSLMEQEKRTLATIIYYPEKKLSLLLEGKDNSHEWYRIILFRLIKIARYVSLKYTRSMVRKAIPGDFQYILEELLHEQESLETKYEYYKSIVNTIIETQRAGAFIIAISKLIQRLSISHLHIIGDIFDRGPGAHIIMDTLLSYHKVDIQWGNHDILWMGAAAGSKACIANVIRIALKYANTQTLEHGYGVSLLPLASLAMEVYGDDPCTCFTTRAGDDITVNEKLVLARMHKAITIIQLKLEAAVIKRRKSFDMADRIFLDKIDREKGVVVIDGKEYALTDSSFPTLQEKNPLKLTPEERAVIDKLKSACIHSDRFQSHARFLFTKGRMYLVHNNNLLYHGCILLNEDSSFYQYSIDGEKMGPREFMDYAEMVARQGFFSSVKKKKQYGRDMLWYLWSGKKSPLFGKDKMATFERYFTSEKKLMEEPKNRYYSLRDDEEVCKRILAEFGCDPDNSHIINGHVPVAVKKGESPVKANGRLIVIDGGFSKAYQAQTGIAGYTLVNNSWGYILVSHKAFESTTEAVEKDYDIYTHNMILEKAPVRMRVKDTDEGKDIQKKIDSLSLLLKAYRSGKIRELSSH